MKVGVMVESFRAGLEGGLRAAAEVGADGVQMYATEGEKHPDRMNGAARAALRRRVGGLGLEFAAICGDFGGHGFNSRAEANAGRIAESKKVMELALELGCRVVTTHIGSVPGKKSHPRYAVLARACEELGRFGESCGGKFAIETGPEPAAVLRGFLDDVGTAGLGANFDPANLVMVIGEKIPAAVEALGPYIVHTHAKDGVQLGPVDAEKLYEAFAVGGMAAVEAGRQIKEVPLGEGGVDFPTYLAALRQTGYDGYLTIEREAGAEPRRDIEMAVRFLRKLVGGRESP